MTSVTACPIDNHAFSVPFAIFHVQTKFYFFFCKALVHQTVMGNFPFQFANGRSPHNYCRTLWAMCLSTPTSCRYAIIGFYGSVVFTSVFSLVMYNIILIFSNLHQHYYFRHHICQFLHAGYKNYHRKGVCS